MTWSLGLTADGDLALGGKGLAKVANEQKLVQDLRCEILQAKGTNKFDVNYGSDINNSIIGEVDVEYSNLKIESEIADIIRRYQTRQLIRAKADKMSLGVATLTMKEVVVDFAITQIFQNKTALNVNIDLTTAKSTTEYPIQLTISM